MMTRRIVRSLCQLGVLATFVIGLLLFLDRRFRVLPTSIHNHLPAHHPGLIITDITLKTCSSLNPLSSCQLDPEVWHRIEKDLYIGSGWVSAAYLHVQRKKEEELLPEDKIVLDVKVGRLDPAVGEHGRSDERWESRPAGIWVHRTSKQHHSDSARAITAVDVLFGSDAVEPRLGWSIKGTPLLLDTPKEALEAHLSVRSGPLQKFEPALARVRKDGKFKIMQAADLHLSTGPGVCRDPEPANHNGGRCDADTRTLDFVTKLLDEEKPDLIILSGDQVNGDTAPDVQSAVFKFAELFITRNIPYAAIFGNHDDEGRLPRAAQMSLMESLPYSLSQAGPDSIDGVGNYVVEVFAPGTSQHAALTLYLLDSHGYSPDEKQFHGYDWIKENQIKWFKDTSRALKKKHREYTKIHMDMAFIHIPLPEYRNRENTIVGEWREGVTAPAFNSGFKDALVEEGVLAVSCGHDHANDYCSLSESKTSGEPELWMCYGGGAGFGGYGGYGGYHRRIRFFEIDTNAARITTYKRLEYGDTGKRLDEQVIVNGGKVIA